MPDPRKAAEQVLDVLDTLRKGDSGRFVDIRDIGD